MYSKSHLTIATIAGIITGATLMSAFIYAGHTNWPSYLLLTTTTTTNYLQSKPPTPTPTPIQLTAILHYATSKTTPQQNLAEITLSFNVLKSLSPCNFLVFGLGHDSLMWASLNPYGLTLFLEEDPSWVKTVLSQSPFLNAKTVPYRTNLTQADSLLGGYKSQPECLPYRTYLKGNVKCKLALENLPQQVYDNEWDVIMIDAPRGYFPAAPGRMSAIFSAAVMSSRRKKSGGTHVFLHDVDRKIEKEYAKEFLCLKYRVESSGRLWHFVIPSRNFTHATTSFC